MALSVGNLNVYPFNQATVVDNESSMTNYALTAHTDAAYIAAYPTVGSGGTVGVFTPSTSIYIAGFLDGSEKSRLFYTDGSTIALPLLKSISQTIVSDAGQVGVSGTGTKGGGFKVVLTPASNNLIDATSPMTFYLDGYTMLIIASTQYG
jgi:hypothetical protein